VQLLACLFAVCKLQQTQELFDLQLFFLFLFLLNVLITKFNVYLLT